MYSEVRLRVKAIIKSVTGYFAGLKLSYISKTFQKRGLILSRERSECTKTYMRTRIHDKTKNGFLKGEGYKQWLWFVGLWLSGLLAVLFLAKLIKFALTFLRL